MPPLTTFSCDIQMAHTYLYVISAHLLISQAHPAYSIHDLMKTHSIQLIFD